MIERKLINSLQNDLGLSEDKVEVAIFGYRLFVYSFLAYIFIVLVAYVLGTVKVTLTAALTASTFRIFSGGAHASNHKRCLIIGTLVFNLIGLTTTIYYKFVSMYLLNWFFRVTTIIALIIFIIYAPADTPGKPITSKVQRGKLKGISIVLLLFWLIFCKFVFKGETNTYRLYYLASILGLAWQSITLLPATYRWFMFK